jgi:hypothetical protein
MEEVEGMGWEWDGKWRGERKRDDMLSALSVSIPYRK